MRVAVCIAGQARNVQVCAESLAKTLLGGRECDFFVHSWSQSDVHPHSRYEEFVAGEVRWKRLWKRRQFKKRFEEYRERMDTRSRSFPRDAEAVRSVLEEAYRPVRMSVEPQATFDVSRFDRSPQNATVKLEETNPRNLLSMFTSIQRACALKSQYEREHDIRYDCVVRCRSDLFFFGPFSLSDYADRLETYVAIPQGGDFRGGINDQLAFSSSRNMDSYCSTVDFVDSHYLAGGLLHAESLLAANLVSKGLKVDRVPIDYEIVRQSFGSAPEFLAARQKTPASADVGAPSFRNPGTAKIASS